MTRFSRLSFSVIRIVPPRPLTFALTRLVCFEASISQTSLASIPLARARERIGCTTRWSARRFGLLNSGTITTGAISAMKAQKAIVAIAPQTHQVRGSARDDRVEIGERDRAEDEREERSPSPPRRTSRRA